jgi:D-amino-acid dehydrogenase
MIQLLNLGTYSRASLQELRLETGIEYDSLTKGILHFYTSEKEFDNAMEPARVMRELGCQRDVIDSRKAVELEPALAHIAPRIAGATYTSADESGDVYKFTTGLAARCAEQGVVFRYGMRVQQLLVESGEMTGVEVANELGCYETLQADAYVLAMGSFSAPIGRQAGLSLEIYPAKGYSVTLPVLDASKTPSVSLTDDEFKLVFSRLGDRLRIAGTAELNGYDMSLNRLRCEAIVRRTLEVFPGFSRAELASYWTGLRPATPGNVPFIGRSRVSGLYLNTGHGTLGWTHACGSGRALALLMSGKTPDIDFGWS